MSAEIILAKTAGFCFGVGRAVDLCEKLLEERPIATLGPIIHNDYVVQSLESKGCVTVEQPEETPDGSVLVIRSHGVGKEVYDRCEALGIEVADATCPFVAKIHDIVDRHSRDGYRVLIAGDSRHPEVRGIVGHCHGEVDIFANEQQLEALSAGRNLSQKNHIGRPNDLQSATISRMFGAGKKNIYKFIDF